MSQYYSFLVVFATLWSSLSSGTKEIETDERKSLILVDDGTRAKNLRLPICMTREPIRNAYSFTRPKDQEDVKEYFFCPPDGPLNGLINEYKNCLIPNDNQIPNTCTKPVKPIIVSAESHCLQDKGKVYNFGFQPCLWQTNKKKMRTGTLTIEPFQAVYTICYNEEKKQVMRITHKIYSPVLWKNLFLKNEREKEYPLDTNGFGLFGEQFDGFLELYSKKLNEPDSNLKMQYIVPPGNMAFSVWKRAVYHYINTKLVLKSTANILDHVNQFIQKQALEFLGEMRITDGFRYSNASEDLEIWWRIIFTEDQNAGMVIVIHNTTEQPSDKDKLCRVSVCEQYGWKDVILEEMKPYAYCCEVKTFSKDRGYATIKKTINLKSKYNRAFKSSYLTKVQSC